MIINYPDYVYKGWHTTLIGYATVAVPLVFNIFARKTLKPIEYVGVALHFMFFIIFVVVLATLGGRNSASYVFTANSGGVSGWTNPGVQWCIGLLSVAFPLTAFDGVLHLSDEVKNPETRIPRSMIVSWLVSTVAAFAFMIILLFFMGDPEKALNSPSGWPIIQICYQAAKQLNGANALMSMIILPGIISYFNCMASVARLAWAFGKHCIAKVTTRCCADGKIARDDGLPFSGYFKVVRYILLSGPTRS